jgi:hypothetical protein
MRGSPALWAVYRDIEAHRAEIEAGIVARIHRRVLADHTALQDGSPIAFARLIAAEVREFARPHLEHLAGGEAALFANLASDMAHHLFGSLVEGGVVTADVATWPLHELSLALRINPPARTAS